MIQLNVCDRTQYQTKQNKMKTVILYWRNII